MELSGWVFSVTRPEFLGHAPWRAALLKSKDRSCSPTLATMGKQAGMPIMRPPASAMASILAGAGLVAPALTFGIWALRDMPQAVEIMGRPGLTLIFVLLLTVPLFILAFGLLGRIVIAYLEEDEGGPK
jgi:hypothetical protein